MSATRDLITTAATGLAEATGVSTQLANLWATIFAENAASHPIEQGETDDQWVARLAGETSADIQALCAEFLTDRDAFRRLTAALAVVAKDEFGHHHTRKPWDEVSAPAKEILEMKRSRKDTE